MRKKILACCTLLGSLFLSCEPRVPDPPAPEPRRFSVTYQANGATGGTLPGDQTKIENVPLVLQTNTGGLTKTGHDFSGWNRALDGSGVTYAPGQTYTDNADLPLYAQWTSQPKVYTEDAPLVMKYTQTVISIEKNGATSSQTHRFHFKGPNNYNVDKTQAYPLVVALHPSGYPNSEEALGIPSTHWAYLQDNKPYARLNGAGIPPTFEYSPICPPPYVSTSSQPTAPNGGEWNSPEAKQMIISTIKDLMNRFHIDPKRIYLVGFSMGGAGSWYIAQEFFNQTGIPLAAIVRGAGYTPTNQMVDQGLFPDLYRSAVWFHVGENDTMALGPGSLGNRALAQYTYEKLKLQFPTGVETLSTRTTADFLTRPSPDDGLTAAFSDFSVQGKSRFRLSVYQGQGHQFSAPRNTDYITWIFSQGN